MAINTELVGHCNCPLCLADGVTTKAQVRKGKRRFLIDCPEHGTGNWQGAHGQKFIKDNMVPISENPAPSVEPEPKPEPETSAEQVLETVQETKAQKRRKWGFL